MTLTREAALEILRRENPKARADELAIYADAFLTYAEAAANIDKNGTIVAHPRTGAPIDNPYAKVRDAAGRTMQRVRRVRNVEALWKALEEPAPTHKAGRKS